MADKTSIEWTDATWSPIRARVRQDAATIAKAKGYTSLVSIAEKMAGRVGPHCEHASPGCDHCYSEGNNGRCLPANGTGLPFDRRSRDLIEPFIDEKALELPLRWKRGRRIFVENQSDLFGEWVLDEEIDRVMSEIAGAGRHTFQVLTKRASRMAQYFRRFKPDGRGWVTPGGLDAEETHCPINAAKWPIPNLWLGVSAEDQQRADERIPDLLRTPAAVRFLSMEPLLGPVDLKQAHFTDGPEIDWVIVGGESGPGARPMHPDWVRGIRDQCVAAGVPFFFKQWGAFRPVGCADADSDECDFEAVETADVDATMRVWPNGAVDDGAFEGAAKGAWFMEHVGKKRAGHLLDGREWGQMPKAKEAVCRA